MEITKRDLVHCLNRFDIYGAVSQWKLLADGPDHPVPYDVIRKIIYIELDTGLKVVMKFIREEVFPVRVIDSQCVFSDLLQSQGIRTPKRWQKNGSYCVSYTKEQLEMAVTVEEWMGEKIPHLTVELFGQVGALWGRIHSIALKERYHIGFCLLYDEICRRDTSYGRLWGQTNYDFIPEVFWGELLTLYNQRLAQAKQIWNSLPAASVQGDIYSCNNLAMVDGILGIYDFNLAGDEVLIGDILLCWFRTIFDERIANDLAELDSDEMWREFILAYQGQRPFTEVERQYLPAVYGLLGTVYFTKLLVSWINTNQRDRAVANYGRLMDLIRTERLPYIPAEANEAIV